MAVGPINPPSEDLSATQEWLSEGELAAQIGVDRAEIKKRRPFLRSGEVREAGNVIVWSLQAVRRLMDELGLASAQKSAPAKPQEAGAASETLTVFSQPGASGHHFGNHMLIKARRECGEVVVVRVHDSSKYTTRLFNGQPMTFRARKCPDGAWWVPTGREPRWRGRW